MTVGSFVLLGLLVGILTITEVNADVEPNDNVTIAEEIGIGTHKGILSDTDYSDYYKVEVGKGKEVYVIGSIPESTLYDSVTIFSCNSLGAADNIVQIYLSPAVKNAECDWKNEGSSRTFMYLYVSGQGSYTIKISESPSPNRDNPWCGNIILLTTPLLLIVGSIIIIKRIRTRDLR